MIAVYTAAVFVGAALVFLVQPLIAKQLLPRLGGSPAVWNACMVFFQAALLAGYGYAHAIRSIRDPRKAAGLHLLFLLLPLALLPLVIPRDWTPGAAWPPLWVLGVLTLSVGLPFVAASTTSPLLQHWFSRTDHPHASDPYFLYAASNAGSLLGLLSYPSLIEPRLAVAEQAQVWSVGYGLFLLLAAACAALLYRRGAPQHEPQPPDSAAPPEGEDAPPAAVGAPAPEAQGARLRLRWVLLSLAPSSLVLGVTHSLSTDMAAVPLLWVVPLALYLLTFVLAFSPRARVLVRLNELGLPVVLLGLTLAFLTGAFDPLWLLVALHLTGLFMCALACHGWLAEERPPAAGLTEFFLWVALGGVLGGSFNALVGPALFPDLYEYPLMLVLVAALRPGWRPLTLAASRSQGAQPKGSPQDGPQQEEAPDPAQAKELPPAALYLTPFLLGAIYLILERVIVAYGYESNPAVRLAQAVVPLLGAYLLSRRRYPFAFALAVLLCLPFAFPRDKATYGQRLHLERTFFGVHSVWEDGSERLLMHGSTIHGTQRSELGNTPLAYYTRRGPIGDVFRLLERDPRGRRVGLIGLGVGSLAAYGRPGQRFTFYEIDGTVEQLARRYFTFLGDSAAEVEVVIGDGRLELAQAEAGSFGLIVLDAFSSDAIPTHLLTREALELYLSKLQPRGLLAFHISNRYVDLKPVLSNLAFALGLTMRVRYDEDVSDEMRALGILRSHWVVLAREPLHLGALLRHRGWKATEPRPQQRLWTDDYSNVLELMSFR